MVCERIGLVASPMLKWWLWNTDGRQQNQQGSGIGTGRRDQKLLLVNVSDFRTGIFIKIQHLQKVCNASNQKSTEYSELHFLVSGLNVSNPMHTNVKASGQDLHCATWGTVLMYQGYHGYPITIGGSRQPSWCILGSTIAEHAMWVKGSSRADFNAVWA